METKTNAPVKKPAPKKRGRPAKKAPVRRKAESTPVVETAVVEIPQEQIEIIVAQVEPENEIMEETKLTENETMTLAESVRPEVQAPPAPVKRERKTLKSFDQNELIELKNFSPGKLMFRGNSGYTVTWADFGAVELIPFSELIKMRNEAPGFFKNNWVIPVGDDAADIIDALQLGRYYSDMSVFENFDALFDQSADQLRRFIEKQSPAMRETIACRAYSLIKSGGIDSSSAIKAIQDATGLELEVE